ncbi:MAG: hypothetical protein HKN37_13720 [Rhodothermales bacterium]|nr:FG-GAP repeat protein [Acidimicrobiia bacterium]NNE47707.1 hypothetical protein [Rhodothermales bacterium]
MNEVDQVSYVEAAFARTVACSVLLGSVAPADAQCEVASLGPTRSSFSHLVAIDDDIAVVGDPGDGIGIVRVYRSDDGVWTLECTLHSSKPDADEFFGSSVAVHEDCLVVGAPLADDLGPASGAVEVFSYSGTAWAFMARLTASDGDSADGFGNSVAIYGDTIVAGAPGDEREDVIFVGSAYVFRHADSEWHQEEKLLGPRIGEFVFGESVSLRDDIVLIGSPGAGKAYIFARDRAEWTLETELAPSTAGADSRFGWSVSLGIGRAAIGAFNDDGTTGSAWIFLDDLSRWTEEARVIASDGQPGEWFGRAVAINSDGTTLLVGAPNDSGFMGSTYVYRRSRESWIERTRLLSEPSFGFGSGVAISNDWAIIGAIGFAHAFAGMMDVDCNENGSPDSCDILAGDSLDVDGDGIPDECEACLADLDSSGEVSFNDLLAVVAVWGPCNDCTADLDDSGDVGFTDLLIMLSNWGPCE